MSFSLAEIDAFIAVVRSGTFTAAAKQVHITQPALSRRIQLIERSLGTPLFERLPTGPKLTEAGQEFLPHAEAVLTALKEALDAARGTIKGDRGHVSFITISALCTERLVHALRQFRNDAPGTELSLSFHAKTADDVSEALLQGEASWGLRYGQDPRLHAEIVGEEHLLIVCSPDHSLANSRNVSARRLNEETWICHPMGINQVDDRVPSSMPSSGRAGDQVMITDSIAAQKNLIQSGFGIGLMPQSAIVNEFRENSLCVVDSATLKWTVPIVLVRRKSAFVSNVSRRLAQRIIESHKESAAQSECLP